MYIVQYKYIIYRTGLSKKGPGATVMRRPLYSILASYVEAPALNFLATGRGGGRKSKMFAP
jgi:hypothetical protein